MSTREVIAFARAHGGVITAGEAQELGMPKSTLSRRVVDDVFVRLGRGVLALPGTASRPDALLRAGDRKLGAVVSHITAAGIHRMEPLVKAPPTVTVPHRGTDVFPGLRVHQATDLLPEHVLEIRGLRVTTPARTIVDLAKIVQERRLEKIVDNALAGGIVDFDELVMLYLALTRQGKKGMPAVGRILRNRVDGELVPITVIEAKLFDLLIDIGIPAPRREFHAPWLDPIRGRVDFAYVDEGVLIEADSRRWHGLFDAFESDRRRDITAQLAGWIVLRFTWKMLTEEPEFVIASVRSALALRQG